MSPPGRFDLDRGRWRLRARRLRGYLEWLHDPVSYRRALRLRRQLVARGESVPALDVKLRGDLALTLNDFHEIQTFELIFFSGIYSPTPMHRARLRNACVLDVGAHVGIFAFFAVMSGARKVVAVEPVPELAARLRESATRADVDDRIIVIEAAASADGRTISLGLQKESVAHSAHVPSDTAISVPSVTLEHALAKAGERSADYLKFNCEGAEFELWAAMKPDVLAPTCTALVGWHSMSGLPSRAALETDLRRNGFSVREYANRNVPFLVADRS